jgi:cell division protein FtsN
MGNSNEIILTWRFGSSSKMDRLESEIKRLKQQQSKKDENTEKAIKEKLEEVREEIRREYQRQAEQQPPQQPPQSTPDRSKATTPAQQPATPQQTTGYTSGGQPIQASELASNVTPGSKGFYVVAGVFSNQANAERLVADLRKRGFDANFFQDTNNKMFYVYLFKFDNYNRANQVRQNRMDGRYNDELWIKIVD